MASASPPVHPAPDTTDIAVSDDTLARSLAERAGGLLLDLRARWSGGDPRELKDEGDRASHEFLMSELTRLRPGDAVLSEEGADDSRRLSADRVWIIDPLDGTREFGEIERDDWAVHVALWQRGTLVAGAVALPARGTTLATDAPPRLPAAGSGPLRIAVSRTRPPALMARLVETLDAELVPMGSAGAKVSAVALGEVDAYVHAGGQYEWDSAAPVAVALEAGAHACRIDGSPLIYNQPDPLLPDLLVCRPELAATLLDAISRAHAAV